jgi:glycosyltransferase involved in cell wall biosynthesis
MRTLHQLVDTIVHGDAISNECLQIQDYLKKLGYHSDIYARSSLIRTRRIKYYKDMPKESDFIFHHSTITPLISYISRLPGRKALIYHNITPGAFFKNYNYQLFKLFHEAERQNYMLSQIPFAGIIGDSRYNLDLIKEFVQTPYEAVIPPFISLQFKKKDVVQLPTDDLKPFTILFVGRFAPNKKQSDIVKVFEYYSKFLNSKARLFLLGFHAPTDAYFNEIYTYIQKRDIQNVFIRANLTSDELAQVYKQSDLLPFFVEFTSIQWY